MTSKSFKAGGPGSTEGTEAVPAKTKSNLIRVQTGADEPNEEGRQFRESKKVAVAAEDALPLPDPASHGPVGHNGGEARGPENK